VFRLNIFDLTKILNNFCISCSALMLFVGCWEILLQQRTTGCYGCWASSSFVFHDISLKFKLQELLLGITVWCIHSSRLTKCKLDSLRWCFQHRSPMPHCWGSHPGALWPTNLNSAEIFVQCTNPASFIILCLLIRMLTNKRTHKQTDTAENIQRSSLCYDVG